MIDPASDGWIKVKKFFNAFPKDSLIPRDAYFSVMKAETILADTYLDTLRCYLQRAGYLSDDREIRGRGIYLKVKNIPLKLTLNGVRREAYPKDVNDEMGQTIRG